MMASGNFSDPEWEPTEEEHAALMEGMRRRVLYRKAMSARGIKVLAMNLSPEQEHALVTAWWREEGAHLHESNPQR